MTKAGMKPALVVLVFAGTTRGATSLQEKRSPQARWRPRTTVVLRQPPFPPPRRNRRARRQGQCLETQWPNKSDFRAKDGLRICGCVQSRNIRVVGRRRLPEEKQEQDDERNRNADQPEKKCAAHNVLRLEYFDGGTTRQWREKFR
jgi:hypothetical protein